jgi:hypothetical protein
MNSLKKLANLSVQSVGNSQKNAWGWHGEETIAAMTDLSPDLIEY